MEDQRTESESTEDARGDAADAPATTPSLRQTLDALFEPWDRSDAPGLVVGIARDGALLYRRGVGLATVEHGVANTPTTRMRIGSTSKHFACVAALLLAEEGKLDIDAPVQDILPELPLLDGAPTLRDFMNHTSGYRDYVDLISLTSAGVQHGPGCGWSMQVRQSAANFPPGGGQLYCNGGYHLLSIAIERASGMPFERFMRERLFEPLSMVDTDSQPSDMTLSRGIATMHAKAADGGWRRGIFITEEIKGEGAIVSTVDDMLRWLAHLRAPTVVGSAAIWQAMARPATLTNGSSSIYSMGLNRHRYRGLDAIQHSGSVVGGMCQMLTIPSHALDVIIMTNGALVSPIELGWRIVDAVLADDVVGPAVTRPKTERFASLAGTRYLSDDGHVIGFADVNGTLGISYDGSSAAPLIRDEGDTLRIGFEDVAMGPFVWQVDDLANRKLAPDRITMSETGNPVVLRKLPKRPPSLASVASHVIGRYDCLDLDAVAEVAADGDDLVLSIVGGYGNLRMKMTPWSEDAFRLSVLDPRSGGDYTALVERRRGRVSALLVSSMRTRRLRFERRT